MKTLFERYLIEENSPRTKAILHDVFKIMHDVEKKYGHIKEWWGWSDVDFNNSNEIHLKGNNTDRDAVVRILDEVISILKHKYGNEVDAVYYFDDRDDPYFNDTEYDEDMVYFNVKVNANDKR